MNLVRDLARRLCEGYPGEAARLLEELEPAAAAGVLAALPPGAAAPVLARLAPFRSAAALEALDPGAAGPILEALPLDDAARCLRPLPAAVRDAHRARVPRAAADALAALLRSPEGTAGSLMDPRALALAEDRTVGEALERIRAEARFLRHYLYVVSRDGGRLVGAASLRMLLLAHPDERLSATMAPAGERISASAGIAAILAHPGWRRFPTLPVVDDRGAFVGAIHYEAARRHAAEAEREDPARSAMTTVASLGELWWIGFAGMFAGLVTPVAPRDSRRAGGR